jgi:hypothetical protein
MAEDNKFNIMIVAIVAIVAVVAIVLIVVGNVNVGTAGKVATAGTSGNLQGNAMAISCATKCGDYAHTYCTHSDDKMNCMQQVYDSCMSACQE